jgi:hypothetical protein
VTSRRSSKVEHRPVPWPRPRASVVRRAAYALVFVWVSFAFHLVALHGSRRSDAIAPPAFDLARAPDDPLARWVDRALGALLERSDTAEVASPDVASTGSGVAR